MIKGVRVQGTNSGYPVAVYAATTFVSMQPLLTVPTGKTFILTDMSVGFTMSTSVGTGMMLPGIALCDKAAAAGGTAGSAGSIKVLYRPKMQGYGHSNAVADIQLNEPFVITDLVNGPEFQTCVSALNPGTWTVPTFGVTVQGILR